MRAPVFPIAFTASSAPAQRAGPTSIAHQTSLKTALAVLIGLLLGLSSTAWLLDRRVNISALRIGPWTTWPKSGTSDIDPYARAIYAQSGQIALASGEGMLLWASTDDQGAPLSGGCSYTIAGELPSARFWTLGVANAAGMLIENSAGRHAFTSAEVLRRSDGSFVVTASSSVRPGNWLPLSGDERFTLLLRVYDPAASNTLARLERSALPSVRKEECR